MRLRLFRPAASRRAPGGSGPPLPDLAWIDEFFAQAGRWIFAREEDGVVILPPNQVYKANATGISIVRFLQAGGKAREIPGVDEPARAAEVAAFVADLRALSTGEPVPGAGMEPVAYSFSYTKLPILGEIAVTYRCTHACQFCYAGCGGSGAVCGAGARGPSPLPRDTADGREMTLDEVKRILHVFKHDARIPFFSFTGGEPLLRRDLEQMISAGRSLGLEVNLITNGALADPARARSLYRAGLRTAQVSIESDEASIHDELTARPGSFEKTLAGIRALKAAGISVQTNTTVNAKNAAIAARMPRFLRSLDVQRFAMNLYLPLEGEHEAALFLPYTRAGAIVDAVHAAARAEGLTFYWYSPLPQCHYNTIARGLGNKSCAAMDGLLSVSASGDVLPCSSYPEPMGNLLRQDFREIWFSQRAAWFKNKRYAPAECEGCGSFTACQAACPLYWQRVGTAELAGADPRAAGRPGAAAV